MVEDLVKRRWHADLVGDRAAHLWALNLYRAGERHPQTVTDYFPAAAAPAPELADALRTHEADEARHTRMYGALIEAMGGEVVDVDDADVFNHQIRAAGGATFAVADGDDADTRRVKVGHFLLHAHFLEARVGRSMRWHLGAAQELPRVVAVMEAVLADELEHVAYTDRWARELLTADEYDRIADHHRRAEARANKTFSARQCRTWVDRFGHTPDRRALYRACAWFMEATA